MNTIKYGTSVAIVHHSTLTVYLTLWLINTVQRVYNSSAQSQKIVIHQNGSQELLSTEMYIIHPEMYM